MASAAKQATDAANDGNPVMQQLMGMGYQMKQKRDYMRERDIEALNHVLSDELGRWFFYRILDRAKLNSQSFTGNSTTFFNEGMRAVAISLQNDLGKVGDGVEGVKKYHLAQIENIQMQKYFKSLEQSELEKGE